MTSKTAPSSSEDKKHAALLAGGAAALSIGSFLGGWFLRKSNLVKPKHKYVLNYYEMRARAEVSRLLFKLAGVDFEDHRWPMSKEFKHDEMVEDRQKNPDKYPYGQLPTLEIDGKHLISQAHAIERYLAKQFGFMGKNAVEEAEIDAVVEALSDIHQNFLHVFLKVDPEHQETQFVEHYKRFDNTFRRLERYLEENGGGKFLFPSGLSLADLVVYQWLYTVKIEQLAEQMFANLPRLRQHMKDIEAVPAIKEHLGSRPNTFF